LKKKKSDREQRCQVNNSVIFSGELLGHEEFLTRMVKALVIIIDRLPKGGLRKIES